MGLIYETWAERICLNNSHLLILTVLDCTPRGNKLLMVLHIAITAQPKKKKSPVKMSKNPSKYVMYCCFLSKFLVRIFRYFIWKQTKKDYLKCIWVLMFEALMFHCWFLRVYLISLVHMDHPALLHSRQWYSLSWPHLGLSVMYHWHTYTHTHSKQMIDCSIILMKDVLSRFISSNPCKCVIHLVLSIPHEMVH